MYENRETCGSSGRSERSGCFVLACFATPFSSSLRKVTTAAICRNDAEPAGVAVAAAPAYPAPPPAAAPSTGAGEEAAAAPAASFSFCRTISAPAGSRWASGGVRDVGAAIWDLLLRFAAQCGQAAAAAVPPLLAHAPATFRAFDLRSLGKPRSPPQLLCLPPPLIQLVNAILHYLVRMNGR